MNINKINKNESDISFVIEVDREDWQKIQEKAFKKLAKNLKISGGFRPGNIAHTNKARTLISEGEIIEQAINDETKIINKKLISEKDFLDLEDDLLNMPPSLEIEKVNKDELTLIFKFIKIPTITIGDYKNIKIDNKFKVNKVDILNEKNKFLEKWSELIPKKNSFVEQGDIVIFDFEGFIDGEKMENGSSKNFELEIGSNQFIPGFENQMINLKINQDAEIKLIFPKDYHEKKIAGKSAIFKIRINDIKEKKIPTIDDKFIQSLKIDDIKNKIDFEKYISKKVERDLKEKNIKELKPKIFQELANITKLSHKDEFSVEQEKKSIESEYNKMLSDSNIDLNNFLKITKQDKNKFYQNIEKQAIENVKIKYAIIEISEKEKIDISEKEFEDYLDEVSKYEKIKLEDLKKQIKDNIEIIKEKLIFNKTIDFLVDIISK